MMLNRPKMAPASTRLKSFITPSVFHYQRHQWDNQQFPIFRSFLQILSDFHLLPLVDNLHSLLIFGISIDLPAHQVEFSVQQQHINQQFFTNQSFHVYSHVHQLLNSIIEVNFRHPPAINFLSLSTTYKYILSSSFLHTRLLRSQLSFYRHRVRPLL